MDASRDLDLDPAMALRLRRACVAAGDEARFATLVDGLLEQHRRRPTLVTMLRRLPR